MFKDQLRPARPRGFQVGAARARRCRLALGAGQLRPSDNRGLFVGTAGGCGWFTVGTGVTGCLWIWGILIRTRGTTLIVQHTEAIPAPELFAVGVVGTTLLSLADTTAVRWDARTGWRTKDAVAKTTPLVQTALAPLYIMTDALVLWWVVVVSRVVDCNHPTVRKKRIML